MTRDDNRRSCLDCVCVRGKEEREKLHESLECTQEGENGATVNGKRYQSAHLLWQQEKVDGCRWWGVEWKMQRRLMPEYLDSRIGMLHFTVPVNSITERWRVAQQKNECWFKSDGVDWTVSEMQNLCDACLWNFIWLIIGQWKLWGVIIHICCLLL